MIVLFASVDRIQTVHPHAFNEAEKRWKSRESRVILCVLIAVNAICTEKSDRMESTDLCSSH